MHPDVSAAARWVNVQLDERQVAQLSVLTEWLRSEAITAGGIGPGEAAHIDNRHIADSLLYATGPIGDSLVDLGSGAGLPGLVLAIALPTTRVTLVDRSGRRCDLMRRAVRVLDVPNVTVRQAEIADVPDGAFATAAMRATLPPAEAVKELARVATESAVLGLSRRKPPTENGPIVDLVEAAGWRGSVQEIDILEPPSWILIMQPT